MKRPYVMFLLLSLAIVSCVSKPSSVPKWAGSKLTYYVTESGKPQVFYLDQETTEKLQRIIENSKGFEISKASWEIIREVSETPSEGAVFILIPLIPIALGATVFDYITDLGEKECVFELERYHSWGSTTYKLCQRKSDKKWYVFKNNRDYDIDQEKAGKILEAVQEAILKAIER